MGTRFARQQGAFLSGDHPHACGDKDTRFLSFFMLSGSSPRVWGQALDVMEKYVRSRIIPTRVGTSFRAVYTYSHLQDHPHACGDKTDARVFNFRNEGSSPRVWGQVDNERLRVANYGIIPTRVGTSTSYNSNGSLERDHPHACGDKTKEIKENSGFAKSTA